MPITLKGVEMLYPSEAYEKAYDLAFTAAMASQMYTEEEAIEKAKAAGEEAKQAQKKLLEAAGWNGIENEIPMGKGDLYKYVPYDESLIKQLPKELQDLLNVNENYADQEGFPTMRQMQEDIMNNNPSLAADIICSQVYIDYQRRAKEVRERAALLCRKHNVPAIIRPLPKNKCNPYMPTHTKTSCIP